MKTKQPSSRSPRHGLSTFITAALVFMTALAVPERVRADDTEVFFPPLQTTLQAVNPNVMFVIDTSGSMSQKDGQTQTRLQRVQTAFTNLLSTMSANVNIGLMRYSSLLGGPISYPVAPIDSYVNNDGRVQQRILDDASEAYQQTASPQAVTVGATVQTIVLNGTNSNMGLRFDNIAIPTGVTVTGAQVTFYGAGSISTANMPVTITAEASDNAAGYTSANSNITGRTYSSTLPTPVSVPWVLRATSYAVGEDFNTPDLSALINSVTSRAGWCGGNALALKFSTASTSRTLEVYSSNSTATDQAADIQASALAPVLTLTYSPIDSNLATGCNKARLGVQIGSNTNDDSTETTESGTPNQPACKALFLNKTPAAFTAYPNTSSGCGGTGNVAKNGLRFPNVNIPQGATIVSAFIDFTPYVADTSTPTLNIQVENSLNPASFAVTSPNTITARMTTPGAVAGSVSWVTTAWSNTATTPDIKDLIQPLVSNASWSPISNAVSVFITPSSGTGTHAAYASDGSLAYAPRLRVQIQGPAGRLTVRQYLAQVVNGFVAQGGTPTMGVLYEAARYFRGEGAYYGLTRSFGSTYVAGTSVRYPGSTGSNIQIDGSTDYAQTSRVSHQDAFNTAGGAPVHNFPSSCSDFNQTSASCDGESWTGNTVYKSPITDGCQSDNIVLLSDGLPNVTTSASPTGDGKSAKNLILSLPGMSATCAIPTDSTGTVQTEWQCGNELTHYLFTNDQSSAFGGNQSIRTYTIAFSPSVAAGGSDAAGAEFLRNLASNGGGQAFAASTASELSTAFNAIIGNILNINTTFVAPAVTVNTYNRLTNRNELYFAAFRPDTDAVWNGNLKKYQLYQSTSDASPQIYDGSTPPIPAVDTTTGYFKDGTKSFWSATVDGSDISKGGAASNLTNTRNVYTYVGSSAPSNEDLTTTANTFNESNSAITAAMLGLPNTATAANRTSLMQWARGIDVLDENGNGNLTEARKSMGDPLHSEPVLITYGGTDTTPDIALFMGTNSDGLRAFSSIDGHEYFAFIPKSELGNLNHFYADDTDYLHRPYGVDGPITSWVNDANGNGRLYGTGCTAPTFSGCTLDSGEFAYIYAGERRGGMNYYALDVTTHSSSASPTTISPKFLFQITGGGGAGTGDYRELGYTWSSAIHARIRVNATTPKDVLIFAGGYDNNVDGQRDMAVQNNDTMGRALYVADAATGALLWWAGADNTSVHPNLIVPQMKFSVPSAPKAVDLDNDGYVDRVYIADAGGQVFRFILGANSSGVRSLKKSDGTNNVNVQYIANLSGTTTASAHRFYVTPDVALITKNTPTPYISIALGSGYHEHPLYDKNEDRFYVLHDPDVSNGNYTIPDIANASSTAYIRGDSDLYDATSNAVGTVCAPSDTTCSANKTAATSALGTPSTAGTAKGFYIKLTDINTGALKGEKVLSNSITFNSQILFATFQPGVSASTCSAVQGLSRVYQINVNDGTPVRDLTTATIGTDNGTSTLGRTDRSFSLKQGGLPPAPVLIFPSISSTVTTTTNPDGTQSSTRTVTSGSKALPKEVILCVGPECPKIDTPIETTKRSWQKIEN